MKTVALVTLIVGIILAGYVLRTATQERFVPDINDYVKLPPFGLASDVPMSQCPDGTRASYGLCNQALAP
jgi:hypothetical protein